MTERVERELRRFCETWNRVKEILVPNLPPEWRGFLEKRFNCEVRGGECFTLEIGAGGARLERGRDRWAHATIRMEEEDWLRVLGGEYHIWSVMIAGRTEMKLEEAQLGILLGYLLQSFGLMGG